MNFVFIKKKIYLPSLKKSVILFIFFVKIFYFFPSIKPHENLIFSLFHNTSNHSFSHHIFLLFYNIFIPLFVEMIPCHHNIVRIVSCNYNVIYSNFDFYAHHKELLNISFNVISYRIAYLLSRISIFWAYAVLDDNFRVCLACGCGKKGSNTKKDTFSSQSRGFIQN